MISDISLETKPVGEISGKFFVPSYQRGYRWGVEEVKRLLEDIWVNGEQSYCLQPIVVQRRENENAYELIDGQQRLTTLFLIYKYLNKVSFGRIHRPKFSISYECREKSEAYLNNLNSLNILRKDENIDFWFMAQAYETIDGWFQSKGSNQVQSQFFNYLEEKVSIIWYETDDSENVIDIFTRLNIGKIPLTNSELVKALFLSRNSESRTGLKRYKQMEIAYQWDRMENELHYPAFWYFLTNTTDKAYQTRIDLVLDLIAKKKKRNQDAYYTFFHFEKLSKEENLDQIWEEIHQTFMILKEWFQNHELYHKIGYLITAEKISLLECYQLQKDKLKTEFLNAVNKKIRECIKINGHYSDFTLDTPSEAKALHRLLLLFNIESVRLQGEESIWFSFYKYKCPPSGQYGWKVESIHTQEPKFLRSDALRKEWLSIHLNTIESIGKVELIEKVQKKMEEDLDAYDFEAIANEVILALSENTMEKTPVQNISNFVLFPERKDSVLENGVYAVKKKALFEMDRNGAFIPYGTKMVYFKYFRNDADHNAHFWTEKDRKAYLQTMDSVLSPYLDEKFGIEERSEK